MRINIIFTPISFSKGGAGCMRLKYLINEIRNNNNIVISNLIIHKNNNELEENYYYDNVRYKKLLNNNIIFGNLSNLVNIYKYLKFSKLDKNILYFYDVNYNPFDIFIFIVAKMQGYKIVFDEIELYYTKLFKTKENSFFSILVISINQYLLKIFSNHTFCISIEIKKYFKNKSTLLPISYDSNLIDLKRRSTNNELTIVYSGSFAEKDNITSLLVVCRNLMINGYKFRLCLSGKISENQKNVYLNLLKDYELNECVFFMGFLDSTDYNQLLVDSDICIVPRVNSKFANAGFPFKLAEYLITGNAVIISKTGDVSNYLTSDDAILINPDSEIELEKALIDLISNDKLRNKLSLNGKIKAKKYFNPTIQANIIIETIKSV
ncbi:MAG: glycosyltransferase [Paludibacter sp.]